VIVLGSFFLDLCVYFATGPARAQARPETSRCGALPRKYADLLCPDGPDRNGKACVVRESLLPPAGNAPRSLESATAKARGNFGRVTSATATAALFASAGAAQSARWQTKLFEFLLVGGVTLVLFPLAWFLEKHVGLDDSELAVGFLAFHAAYLVNDPHFAVTYLLFYKGARERAFGDVFQPAQRARYLFAGVIVPIALGAWVIMALATESAHVLGLLAQLMFLLVGWHYVKQGFGVLTVLSARRGVRFDALERKVFLAHCFSGWAYAWASPFNPGLEAEEKGVVYTSIAHPPGLERVTDVVFFASTLALIWVLWRIRRRDGKLPPLAPLSGFLITIWFWTVYSSADPLMVYVIPGLHSLQYLYFVWLLKRNEARESEGPPSFGRPVAVRLAILAASAVGLGWLLFRGGPAFLDGTFVLERAAIGDAGERLGATPYFAAIFAFVNIHHYFMDYVIWRRENPETRHLAA